MSTPKLTPHDGITVSFATDINIIREAELLSFYGWLGLTDLYWEKVRPAFNPGPALMVVAQSAQLSERAKPNRIKVVAYGYPHDRKTALLSSLAVQEHYKQDLLLLGAVYLEALERFVELGMESIRYEVPVGSRYLQRVLVAAGFNDQGIVDATNDVIFVAVIKVVLAKLGLSQVCASTLLDSRFSGSEEWDGLLRLVCALQLGGPRQPPGLIGDFNFLPLFASEPGTPDGGTKGIRRASEPGTPDGGTKGIRRASEPGTPDGGTKVRRRGLRT